MEQRIYSLLEEAGPVGMHLSQQRDLCFLQSHSLIVTGSRNITLSLFTGLAEGYSTLLVTLSGREHSATYPSILDQGWGPHEFCRALLMSSHDTLLLLQRGNTNICLHHIYSAHLQTEISLNLKEIRNRKQNVNLTDLFRSNSGAMWEQPSVNTERAVCLCMEHGSLTGHLTWPPAPSSCLPLRPFPPLLTCFAPGLSLKDANCSLSFRHLVRPGGGVIWKLFGR